MRVLPQALKLVPVTVVPSIITKDKEVNNNVHRVWCLGNDVKVSPRLDTQVGWTVILGRRVRMSLGCRILSMSQHPLFV